MAVVRCDHSRPGRRAVRRLGARTGHTLHDRAAAHADDRRRADPRRSAIKRWRFRRSSLREIVPLDPSAVTRSRTTKYCRTADACIPLVDSARCSSSRRARRATARAHRRQRSTIRGTRRRSRARAARDRRAPGDRSADRRSRRIGRDGAGRRTRQSHSRRGSARARHARRHAAQRCATASPGRTAASARQLGAVMVVNASGADSYVLCELAGTTYALRSDDIEQLEMVGRLTPVPNAPAFVDGVDVGARARHSGHQPARAFRFRARAARSAQPAGRRPRRRTYPSDSSSTTRASSPPFPPTRFSRRPKACST